MVYDWTDDMKNDTRYYAINNIDLKYHLRVNYLYSYRKENLVMFKDNAPLKISIHTIPSESNFGMTKYVF